ncbi:MAG: ribose 5-phosphate isomerase [Sphaerochaeta sp.]|jgi:ribose 5-phosphate isomerase B|uniref:RpiB/LacA/LacB family sugar-phosphate isomerase n=1 Tax=Sphaerochaeta halotolerans TaxID=2293840 RepID=A0A372MJJ0_9SPIR|nr:RpiB/LacA/LacB family sugar-phosphate isomerase [Sphaerochaeta halotolerans]MBG0766459.1 RpiB/LacA/LacB family sugar-phosphate isomerase [Spirochaetaceae bacterium]MDK2860053.1 ribose 5-phosphate isomerase [Sphaerochaeta sp.]MDN5333089.1 ribose 5-phosphate isomerase [Sphaerochaeta sp.]RFU95952.1 RpiB/LacA/LacB family sugar-phosphate isomerase [Sphaerochaeta halotolerans]
MPSVVLANDHGAVELAKRLLGYLEKMGYTVNYLGVTSNDSVDYPDIAKEACLEYKKGGYEFGIVLCGTGIGVSISANKVDGIRCALPQNCYAAAMARRHNDANFIAFGGRIDYPEDPVDMLDAFMDATFEGERHQRRVDKIMALEGTC